MKRKCAYLNVSFWRLSKNIVKASPCGSAIIFAIFEDKIKMIKNLRNQKMFTFLGYKIQILKITLLLTLKWTLIGLFCFKTSISVYKVSYLTDYTGFDCLQKPIDCYLISRQIYVLSENYGWWTIVIHQFKNHYCWYTDSGEKVRACRVIRKEF